MNYELDFKENLEASIDLASVCRLDDAQEFYKRAMLRAIENSAIRCLAVLYLIASEGNTLAGLLFEECEDTGKTGAVFMQFREVESTARSLIGAYENRSPGEVDFYLAELGLLLLPFEKLNWALLNNKVKKGSSIRFPLRRGIVYVNEQTDLKSVFEMVFEQTGNGGKAPAASWREDCYAESGIRISPTSFQPRSAGQEFKIIETNSLPSTQSLMLAQKALDGLAALDGQLVRLMASNMKLVSVVPRQSRKVRKAGSVSSLPGWAWQDVDPATDELDEYCHLSVQLTHEFFHTKVNLLEKSIPLYTTDGNFPEIYSPWKKRNRPLRQVIHALLTFSAGGAIWERLLFTLPDSLAIRGQAEKYLKENLAFAEIACKNLAATCVLTSSGIMLVDSCLENLRNVLRGV